MKNKKIIFFILIIVTLFALNGIFLHATNFIIHENSNEMINHEHISSQKLFNNVWATIQENYYDSSLNEQSWQRWKDHYKNKIKTDEDAKVAIQTMLESLDDPYSKYMNKREYADQNTSINSKITGIGVNVASNSGKIQIINVIEGTPAQYSNLQVGDYILAIDNKDVSGMPLADIVNLVRGKENTFVELTILRGEDKFIKKIIRKEIKIKTVKSNVFKNIGYIQLMTFIGSTTPNEFLQALEKTNKTDGLIIDLRGNTGGLLQNAIFIANLFINNGNIVSIVGRNGYKYDIYAQNTQFQINKPVIVLVDEGSASASEILSGALKDHKKAKLLGVKTYGKGMVQKIIPMQNETGLNLTVAKYLTPNGTDINQKGIEPDFHVEFTENDLKKQNDIQLNTAKKIMTEMINQNRLVKK